MEWRDQVDAFVSPDSRWHSSHVGVVHTRDALGDALVAALRKAGSTSADDSALSRWIGSLVWRLEDYEEEPRLLVKLADTGRVVQILQGAVKATLGILNIRDEAAARWWLDREREDRVKMYEGLVENSLEELLTEVQTESQHIEVLTLLKHGLQQYSEVLTQRELDFISTAFTLVVKHSGVVMANTPEWFVGTQAEWYETHVPTPSGGEEGCLRQAAVWSRLQHPNVRRFYGACHVGKPFIIHEMSLPMSERVSQAGFCWKLLHGCALGLEYLHDRGLVHECLSIDTLFVSSANNKGLLGGLGLVRLSETELPGDNAFASDIEALGRAIFRLLVLARDPSGNALALSLPKLPTTRPDYLGADEWKLLCGMSAVGPAHTMAIAEVVREMDKLAKDKDRGQQQVSRGSNSPPQEVENVAVYRFSLGNGTTIPETLRATKELCEQGPEFLDLHLLVHARLEDLYRQLLRADKPLSALLVDDFCLIMWRFCCALEENSPLSYNLTASLCASRTISNQSCEIQQDIDSLILRSPELDASDPVHHWQSKWERFASQHREALDACIENSMEYLAELESDTERFEAEALVQFEAQRRGRDIEEICAVPVWFIPPYQVQRGEYIASGSFGSVYRGRWLDTDVVVKRVLTNCTLPAYRDQFRNELDLWFSLNHENLIKLYGACHEGQPFFVCELAVNGTLPSFLRGKNRFVVWDSLWYAARALGHLHDRGIVHGDLKGNNILVGEDQTKVKLTDFGLSFLASSIGGGDGEEQFATRVVRWKAPECLLGALPTFASDVYSFAMCIVEVVSGEYPWGPKLADAVVAQNVANRKLIPPPPKAFRDDEWGLIERMCCFNPSERISMAAVSRIAYEIGSNWGED